MQKRKIDEKCLVSIVVVTYNSSKYILETLESIRLQSYSKIELIISDDASSDNTLELCRKWLAQWNNRFIRAIILSSKCNKGIPANYNQGFMAATGKWIKSIDGDDLLLSNCINDFMCMIDNSKEDISIVHSNAIYFQGKYLQTKDYKLKIQKELLINKKTIRPCTQYKLLLWRNQINSPSIFISNDLYHKISGGFDESYKLLEDWPMWLKITKAGYKIHYLNLPTVAYRINENSTVHSKNNNCISQYIKTRWNFEKKYIFYELSFISKVVKSFNYNLMQLLDVFGINKNSFWGKCILYLNGRCFILYGNLRNLFIKTFDGYE